MAEPRPRPEPLDTPLDQVEDILRNTISGFPAFRQTALRIGDEALAVNPATADLEGRAEAFSDGAYPTIERAIDEQRLLLGSGVLILGLPLGDRFARVGLHRIRTYTDLREFVGPEIPQSPELTGIWPVTLTFPNSTKLYGKSPRIEVSIGGRRNEISLFKGVPGTKPGELTTAHIRSHITQWTIAQLSQGNKLRAHMIRDELVRFTHKSYYPDDKVVQIFGWWASQCIVDGQPLFLQDGKGGGSTLFRLNPAFKVTTQTEESE